MTYKAYIKQKGELAISLAVGGLLVAVIGLLFGADRVISPTRESTQIQAQTEDVQIIANRDVKMQVDSLSRSRKWDYILSGGLCFTFKPPLRGKYSIEIYDEQALLGSSVKSIITTPSEAVCGKRGLTFAAPFNLNAENSCPNVSVRVHAEGNWPAFAQETAKIPNTVFCANPPTPTAVQQPINTQPASTSTPTQTPQLTQTPTTPPTSIPPTTAPDSASAITGRISIYACIAPTTVNITYCASENSSNCTDLPYVGGPADHGVWIDDTATDRAYIYKYRIVKKTDNTPLSAGDSVYIKDAYALVNRKVVASATRDKKTVQAGQTFDLTIDAQTDSCTCTFKATSFIKDQDDTFLTLYDDKLPLYGTANDKQRARRGEGPVSAFRNGLFSFGPVELNDFSHPESYGRDHLASVKLYHDNAQIIKQVCTSTGETAACPGETWEWEKLASEVRDPKVIDGLRVTCGAELTYGWVVNPQVLEFEGFRINVADLDLNGDGFINTIDYQLVLDEYGASSKSSSADINKDGIINALDLSFIIARMGEEIK